MFHNIENRNAKIGFDNCLRVCVRVLPNVLLKLSLCMMMILQHLLCTCLSRTPKMMHNPQHQSALKLAIFPQARHGPDMKEGRGAAS